MGFLDKLLGKKSGRRVRDDGQSAGRSSAHKTVVNSEYPLPPVPGPAPQAPPPQPGGDAQWPIPQPASPSPAPPIPQAPAAAPAAPAPAPAPLDDGKTVIGGRPAASTSVIGVLVAVQGPDSGSVFALHRQEEILLGRGTGSDVKLSCQSISRPHAKIIFDGEDLILLSMKDENLASVDGEPTEGSELTDGCLIGLGSDTLLRFRKIEGP